ncbi:MAG: TldD/PmbA family protein [Ignisphaera sp.]
MNEIGYELAEEILNEVLGRSVQEAIVRIHEKVTEGVVFDNGKLKVCSFSRVSGIGIAVYMGGSIGYGYTTKFDRESILKAVDEAVSFARNLYRESLEICELKSMIARKDVYRVSCSVNPLDIDIEQKVSLVEKMNKESLNIEGIVSAITRYGFERDRRITVSSFGAKVDVEVVAVGISHTVVARHNDTVERLSDQKTFIGGYEYIEKYDWYNFITEINNLAVKSVQAPAVTPGVYTVVIDSDLIGLLLHEAFGHASEGDIVYADMSVLKDRIGKVVANENVSIVDEGVVPGGYPIPYDDEGFAKEKTYIVKNGILINYLHNISTARKLGYTTTGNARAQDVSYYPLVRQTNLYMLPGNADIEELFEGIKHGIYLKGRSAGGGQVNPSVGTFTFGVGPSYIIKNGEVSELVRNAIVSGNILDVLKDVEMVGKDLKIETSIFGGCGKNGQLVHVGFGGPHIRVKKLVVGAR